MKPYKEPVFLFTSSSLRFAAYAGWYSALGQIEKCEQWRRQAHGEWIKELGAGRRYNFLEYHDNDMYKYVSDEVMERLVNKFFKDIKAEVKRGKEKEKQRVNS